MKYFKKSLGQNFLIDKNVIKKIGDLTKLKNKNIIEIGPGKGAMTNEILKKNPKSLILIEKDNNLADALREKYKKMNKIKIFNSDILKFKLEKFIKKNSIILGNLPYNISSQILIKILKLREFPPKYNDIIFMFQKELGCKIIGKFLTKDYGRLSILRDFKLIVVNNFDVSSNCFFPKPKVTSMVIHFKPKTYNKYKIKNIESLEKITNILFSNKRKMINKNLKKILSKKKINKIKDLNLNYRPSEVSPELFYKITQLYEMN